MSRPRCSYLACLISDSQLNARWQVSCRGSLGYNALNALAAFGIEWIAGKSSQKVVATTRAADAENAIARVRDVIEPYGTFSNWRATPINFMMYVGFLESEANAIDAAAVELRHSDLRVRSVIREPSKASAELLLEMSAQDREDASEQARDVYADVRRRAGLVS